MEAGNGDLKINEAPSSEADDSASEADMFLLKGEPDSEKLPLLQQKQPSRPNLLRRYKHSVRPSLNLDISASLPDMKHPGWLVSLRISNSLVRECFAEFLGTFLLMLIGNGIVANTVFNRLDKLGNIVGPLGWGFTVALMIIVTGGVSGGHVNPAVTVAQATVGKFRWSRVIPYLASQYSGAFFASCVLYGIYKDALDNFDGGVRIVWNHENATGHMFSTYPQEHVSTTTCFFDQIVGTMLLLIAVSGVGDERNVKMPLFLQPLAMCMCITCIIIGFNYNCQAALNPARDLGPRIFTAMAGWGVEVFSYRNYNWFWVPIVGPHLGAILGVWVYKFLVELHWPPAETVQLEPEISIAPSKQETPTPPVQPPNE